MSCPAFGIELAGQTRGDRLFLTLELTGSPRGNILSCVFRLAFPPYLIGGFLVSTFLPDGNGRIGEQDLLMPNMWLINTHVHLSLGSLKKDFW